MTRVPGRDPELVGGFPRKLPRQAGSHWDWEFLGALEFCSVALGTVSRVEFFSRFQGLASGKRRKGPQRLPVFALLRVPLLSLSRFCHILGVPFWVLFVKFLSQDPPLCLSALLDALPMVRYALGWVPWAQDVALIA